MKISNTGSLCIGVGFGCALGLGIATAALQTHVNKARATMAMSMKVADLAQSNVARWEELSHQWQMIAIGCLEIRSRQTPTRYQQ